MSDRRVRRTKKVLKETFISLLQKKEIHRITVKEISDIADVNRSTFYNYYTDVYDMLDKLENEAIELLERVMKEYCTENDQDLISRAFFTELLRVIKENSSLFNLFFVDENGVKFAVKLQNLILTIPDYKVNYDKNVANYYVFSYIASGITGMIQCWLKNEMSAPISDVSEIMKQLMENNYDTCLQFRSRL
ncbi:TetR/AcrR family transcriptional regulator [Vallitalea okinawensis]|uniref:TetR/AcrR family transcriptional regulator n=1 Tax=Vallitalea okinawensis TaxID=2078660 RepID=UPI000CFAC730|nr:TetR-like C-terminal domain-containing protein [Vallitalea okinawensis]